MPLKDIIADFEWYNTASLKWVDVFNCLTLNLKNNKYNADTLSKFIDNVENYRYPTLECLSCSKFFYYNYTNLVSPKKRTPTKIFPLA